MAFNGINNLRDSTESVKILPWQLKELQKCAKDPIYFIENYVYINTKDHGMQLFKMYDFQKSVVKDYENHRFHLQKWPRQCGKCIYPSEKIFVMNEDGEEMEVTIEEFFNLLEEIDD